MWVCWIKKKKVCNSTVQNEDNLFGQTFTDTLNGEIRRYFTRLECPGSMAPLVTNGFSEGSITPAMDHPRRDLQHQPVSSVGLRRALLDCFYPGWQLR